MCAMKLDLLVDVAKATAGALMAYLVFDLAVRDAFAPLQAISCVILAVAIVLLSRRQRTAGR